MGIFTLSKEERALYGPGSENQRNPPVNLPNPSIGTKEENPQPRWTPHAQYHTEGGFEPKDFKGRFLPEEPKSSIFDDLFSNTKQEEGFHPCVHQSSVLHQCLDANNDDIHFCRPAWNILLGCTRTFKQYDALPWYNSFLPFKPLEGNNVEPNLSFWQKYVTPFGMHP